MSLYGCSNREFTLFPHVGSLLLLAFLALNYICCTRAPLKFRLQRHVPRLPLRAVKCVPGQVTAVFGEAATSTKAAEGSNTSPMVVTPSTTLRSTCASAAAPSLNSELLCKVLTSRKREGVGDCGCR